MAKLRVGVVIGRFQLPALHKAHEELLRQTKMDNDVLCVIIGQAPLDGYVVEHTLSFHQRQAVVRRKFPDAVILPNPDAKHDPDWNVQLEKLISLTFPGADVRLYGGRDSFLAHYTGPRNTVQIDQITDISATKVRKSLIEQTDESFLKGQIYGMQKQFPHAYGTVDVAIVRDGAGGPEVLLIKRADTKEWAFPGGFVDPTDDTVEFAGRREVFEELGLTCEGKMVYAGTAKITDWRYRRCRDQIMTTFFVTPYSFGNPSPNPDEVDEAKWFPCDYATPPVCETHVPLWHMMNESLEKL